MSKTETHKSIVLLRSYTELLPIFREPFDNTNINVISRKTDPCKNYLSPHRRDFYKILYLSKGIGVLTIGTNTFYIDQPTIIFIHPNCIISWKNLDDQYEGYYVVFKKGFAESNPVLRASIDQYELFCRQERNVVGLTEGHIAVFNYWFEQMMQQMENKDNLTDDRLQAYLQMLMIESVKVANFSKPDLACVEYRHIHDFFQLLENETCQINITNPVKVKTVKEFAHSLALHPNHLNALLKKHTGQNVSTHIKNRLLEESKTLLVQTDWSLQDIGYSIGFADQPNFSQFFKKKIGLTPQEFRKNFQSVRVC